MHSFINSSAALLLLLLPSASDAFVTLALPPPHLTAVAVAAAAAVAAPPPPTHQQILVLSSSLTDTVKKNDALFTNMAWSSNLPSQSELLSSSSGALLSVAGTATTKVAPAASAAPIMGSFSITGISYDGKVPTSEADEYVVITNGSKSPVDVSGYYVYVATTGTQGPTFTFPSKTVGSTSTSSIIRPGASVRIYTNEIHKETGGYSFGSGKAIWNNRGGVAVLKDSNGKKLGVFQYKPPATAVSAPK